MSDPACDPACDAFPTVSVIMPVRNEERFLRDSVEAILAQHYPGGFDVCLAMAPSSDATDAVAARLVRDHPQVRMVANPSGTTPAGLNAAIAATTGEIIVRVDGHAELSPGYIERAVQTLVRTGAVNVGGVQRAVGVTVFEQAVAAAMGSPFGVGGARFHTGGSQGPVDTVYLGVFRREALERAGGFDACLIRNQDYELNIRLRAAGGTVWFDPSLWAVYRPRGSLLALGRQYFEYGWWKREVLRIHPASLKARQAVPPLVTVAVVGGALTGLRWRCALLAPIGYLAGVALASLKVGRGFTATTARLVVVLPTMHLSWGVGFLSPRGARHPRRCRQ